jgi:hypothetical protein
MHDSTTFLDAGVAIMGAVAILRHYLRLIADPFAGCTNARDFFDRIAYMDDLRFLGLLLGAFFFVLYVRQIVLPLLLGH